MYAQHTQEVVCTQLYVQRMVQQSRGLSELEQGRVSEWLCNTGCITFSFKKCMAVVGKSTHLNDMRISRLKKKTFRSLTVF